MLSPAFLLGAVWLIALIGFSFASASRSEMLYLRFMASAENLREDASALSFLWLAFAFASFLLGPFLASSKSGPARPSSGWSDSRAIRVLTIAFAFVATVAFLWVGVTVLKVGPGRLMSLANSNNIYARELILNSSFPGGRLVSNGFMGIAVFSAMLLGAPRKRRLSPTSQLLAIAYLVVSLSYLGLIPILTSGRINFFAAIIASYVAVCMVRRRFYGLAYLPIALALLAFVWGAKQYFTLRHVLDVSLFDQVTQGAIFYFYNDMLNSVNVVGHIDGNYTLGWNSLRFLFFFTLTDGAILEATTPQRTALSNFIGGGEFPLLTAPYADFGLLGLVVLMIIGYLCQLVYLRAKSDPPMSAVYGFVVAGLLLSIHSSYLTLQDPVFSMILVLVLVKLSSNLGAARLRRPSWRSR